MKRFLIFFFILCVVILAIITFILPSNTSFSKKIYIKTNVNVVNRFLFNDTNWIKWWPAGLQNNLTANNKKGDKEDYAFIPRKQMYGGIIIGVKNNNTEYNTTANLFTINKDSVSIVWDFLMQKTNNPYYKIKNYFFSRTVKKDAATILESLKTFLEKNENIYGLTIKKITVTDTILIAKKYKSTAYPSTQLIYDLVQQLKNYISLNDAEQTSFPMLNIKYDGGYYNTMVAIPVNKILPNEGDISLKIMIPGNILVTEVKGGNFTTNKALKELESYMDDNDLNAPAIPFESLITNRIQEPDTSKWVTKIYYPIY